MRIRANSPRELDELADYLDARVDTILERVDDDLLEISLLGSYTQQAMRREITRRVRAWEEVRRAGAVPLRIC